MDYTRYKCPISIDLELRSITLSVRPLSTFEYDLAVQNAKQRFRRYRIKLVGHHYSLEIMLQVVAAAAGVNANALRYRIYVTDLIHAYEAWSRHDRDSCPDLDHFDAWVRLHIIDDPGIKQEGAMCYQAESVAEFYGQPVTRLTTGQIAYYLTLRNAFHDSFVDQSQKKISKYMLEKRLKERLSEREKTQND